MVYSSVLVASLLSALSIEKYFNDVVSPMLIADVYSVEFESGSEPSVV